MSRRVSILACAAPLSLAPAACNPKNAEKCQESLKVARQALAAQDFELARKWRTYAYSQCQDGAELGALDRDIVGGEAASKARANEVQQAKTETQQLVTVLKQFVQAHKANIAAASSGILCEEPVPPAKSDERWCSASRAVSGKYTLQLRYWDQVREAQEYTITPPNPISCADLGAHMVVASWQVPAVDGRSVPRSHCAITAGELAGFEAIVSAAKNAPLIVFSKQYLERDERLRALATPK